MKIKFTKQSIQNGSDDLVRLYNNLLSGNPFAAQNATDDGTYIILDDIGSRINYDIDQSQLELLLANGGDIEEGIFAVKVNESFKDLSINDGMPFEFNAFGESRTYGNWFVPGAEIYKENDIIPEVTEDDPTPEPIIKDGIIFYSNPGHGIASASQYLKASQIKTIIDLDSNFSVMSTKTFKSDFLNQGWAKIVW